MKLKKVLASILCIAMVLSTMGTVAFAEDTIVLTSTKKLSDLEDNTSYVIDGNNFNYYNSQILAANEDITLTGVNITATNVDANNGLIYIGRYSTLTLKDCTITVQDSPNLERVFGYTDGYTTKATLVLDNSTVIADGVERGFFGINVIAKNGSEINLTNLTAHAFRNVSLQLDSSNLTVSGAETLFKNSGDDWEDKEISVINSTVKAENITAEPITAKVFYTPASSFTIDDEDITSTLNSYVASVNDDVYYTTLEAALKAAQNGDTIKILEDITYTEGEQSFNVPEGVTIDGGNNTITIFDVYNGGSYAAFNGNGAFAIQNMTIVKSGAPLSGVQAISLKNGGSAENITVQGNFGMGIYAGSDATVKGCTFECVGGDSASYGVYMDSQNAENVKITENTFNTARAAILTGGVEFSDNTATEACEKGVSVNSTGSVTITGNTFSGARALSLTSVGESHTISDNKIAGTVETKTSADLSDNYWYDSVPEDKIISENDEAEVVVDSYYKELNDDGSINVDSIFGVPVVEVSDYEQLLAALAKDKANVVMTNDITVSCATESNGYGAAGIVLEAGDILDGKGHTLEVWGADDTWDCAIAMKGGTVKNLTVKKAFRGIFMPAANGNVIIDNCILDNVCYTFNSDDGNKDYGVTIKNTVLNGWTSYSNAHKFVIFENCKFGKGTGGYQYAFFRPYQPTTFTGCEFEKGYEFDTTKTVDNSLEFNECKYDGEYLSTGAGVEMFYNGGNIIIDEEEAKLVDDPVAYIGSLTNFETLAEAVEAAENGDEIKLVKDATGDIVISAPAAAYAMRRAATGITINLNGFTLNGSITIAEGATATIKNGKIVNENSDVSAVETNGTTTIENVDITSARHAVRVENGAATINGGTYKVDNKDGKTTHAINVGRSGSTCEVVITDGTFYGAKGTGADSGAAVNVQSGSTVKINNGKFSGGLNNTLANAGTLAITGGLFDQNPGAFAAEGFEAVETGEENEYKYSVEPLNAPGVKVKFVETDDANIYDIAIASTSYQRIFEFVAATLTFENTSTTIAGDTTAMNYEILGIPGTTNVQKSIDKADTYAIELTADADRMSGREFVIGQVKFFGQGNINFTVTEGEVVATEYGTNKGYYYTLDTDDETADTLTVEPITNGTVEKITREIAVNVAFNHKLREAKYWDDEKFTVTVKDAFGKSETKDLEITSAEAGICSFNVELAEDAGAITVTLEAPGYRRYVYNTTVEPGTEPLVLSFWNNVKRNEEFDGVVIEPAAEIETGKGFMTHNFVAGDIVMDYTVDKYDLAAVTSYYGKYDIPQAEADKYIKYDLNRDGDIDIRDVHYVLHTLKN